MHELAELLAAIIARIKRRVALRHQRTDSRQRCPSIFPCGSIDRRLQERPQRVSGNLHAGCSGLGRTENLGKYEFVASDNKWAWSLLLAETIDGETCLPDTGSEAREITVR